MREEFFYLVVEKERNDSKKLWLEKAEFMNEFMSIKD